MQRNSDTFYKFLKNYWRYYKELEIELLSTSRYVEFVEDNFSTYSVEFLKLYQAVCSEIDVIGKMMAFQVNSSFNPEDTQEARPAVLDNDINTAATSTCPVAAVSKAAASRSRELKSSIVAHTLITHSIF